jgi:biotin carboxyl carrier protein
VEIGGRKQIIEIGGARGAYRAVIDGHESSVDAARAGDSWSLLVGGRSYEVAFGLPSGGELPVQVNGRVVAVKLTRLTPSAARRGLDTRAAGRFDHAVDTGGGPLSVTAPMPGRVVKVLVGVGDVVAPRQGVVVVEAMKMENEVRAPRAGTVKEVRVAEGALVEAKAVLVVVE